MRILNFGSLNIDYVYRVDAFLQPGETRACKSLQVNCGGKGLNQSIAAAKAGSEVFHAGLLGRDGDMLYEKLRDNGVDVSLLRRTGGLCGNAVIQVDDAGQNCILLFGGTNRELTRDYVNESLDAFGGEGLVLLQNETNLIGYIIEQAAARGLQVALNAAPMDKGVLNYPLERLDWLIVNEVEGRQLSGCDNDAEILPALTMRYPHCGILLTLGKNGAICAQHGQQYCIGSYAVNVVDTTAAGDTFTGYFLHGVLSGKKLPEALHLATAASALCVQFYGASDSVPMREEVEALIRANRYGWLEVQELQ